LSHGPELLTLSGRKQFLHQFRWACNTLSRSLGQSFDLSNTNRRNCCQIGSYDVLILNRVNQLFREHVRVEPKAV
jgi:hypothetical protein